MDNKRKILFGILIFVVLLAIAGAAYNQLSKNFSPDSPLNADLQKMPASDFTVLDNDGNEVNLSDFFGKPIVLNFWASWCPPCRREMPHYEKVYSAEKEEIAFLMVDLVSGGETTEAGKAYIADNEFTFPVYFDTQQNAAKVYGITSIPQTFFIDKDGNIVYRYEGSLTEEKLLQYIEFIR